MESGNMETGESNIIETVKTSVGVKPVSEKSSPRTALQKRNDEARRLEDAQRFIDELIALEPGNPSLIQPNVFSYSTTCNQQGDNVCLAFEKKKRRKIVVGSDTSSVGGADKYNSNVRGSSSSSQSSSKFVNQHIDNPPPGGSNNSGPQHSSDGDLYQALPTSSPTSSFGQALPASFRCVTPDYDSEPILRRRFFESSGGSAISLELGENSLAFVDISCTLLSNPIILGNPIAESPSTDPSVPVVRNVPEEESLPEESTTTVSLPAIVDDCIVTENDDNISENTPVSSSFLWYRNRHRRFTSSDDDYDVTTITERESVGGSTDVNIFISENSADQNWAESSDTSTALTK